jgi:hypothetical protein
MRVVSIPGGGAALLVSPGGEIRSRISAGHTEPIHLMHRRQRVQMVARRPENRWNSVHYIDTRIIGTLLHHEIRCSPT